MDKFLNYRDEASDPARGLFTVEPSDGTTLAAIPKALFVGTGGDIRLRGIDDDTPATLKNIADGQILPIRAQQVYSTGTTASNIVALL